MSKLFVCLFWCSTCLSCLKNWCMLLISILYTWLFRKSFPWSASIYHMSRMVACAFTSCLRWKCLYILAYYSDVVLVDHYHHLYPPIKHMLVYWNYFIRKKTYSTLVLSRQCITMLSSVVVWYFFSTGFHIYLIFRCLSCFVATEQQRDSVI